MNKCYITCILIIIIALSNNVFIGGCGGNSVPGNEAVIDHVIVSSAVSILIIEGTTTLTATAYDTDGNVITNAAFDWTTVDPTIAVVDPSGVVTGKAAGQTVIRATEHVSGMMGTIAITVLAPPTLLGMWEKDIDRTELTLNGVYHYRKQRDGTWKILYFESHGLIITDDLYRVQMVDIYGNVFGEFNYIVGSNYHLWYRSMGYSVGVWSEWVDTKRVKVE